MNVYDHISANNRKTAMILCAFPAALFVIVYLFSYIVILTGIPTFVRSGFRHLSGSFIMHAMESLEFDHGFDLGGYLTVTVPYVTQAMDFTLAVYPWVLFAAFIWIVISYRAGDSMILGMAHARHVTPDENRDLFRLVENTAISAGLPTPKIYLIRDESMNAFATGYKPEGASVAMTHGLVKKLDKTELQAVIAHELAHIGNRDTRLMTITVAGIGFFTFFGELLCGMGAAKRSNNRGGSGALFMLAGIAFLVFGYVVAPILRFALSRRREYQADATAVKITRDMDALSRALLKISEDSKVDAFSSCPLAGNMCIADPTIRARGFMNLQNKLYSTHPSIEDRVATLRRMRGNDTDTETPIKTSVGKAVW